MSRRDANLLILDMLDAIDRAELYVEGMSEADFIKDLKTQDAVIRNVQIVGEAANRVPKEFQDSNPEISWKRIARSRHVLVHDYFSTDLEIIWRIIKVHLPELKEQLLYLGK